VILPRKSGDWALDRRLASPLGGRDRTQPGTARPAATVGARRGLATAGRRADWRPACRSGRGDGGVGGAPGIRPV